MTFRLLPPLAFALLLLLAGCNAFGGLSEEGGSSDPAMLMQDADIALQRGEPAKAVQYLRKTLRLDPEHSGARIKLSTALLAESDIGFMDLWRISRAMQGKDANEAAAAAHALAARQPHLSDIGDGVCSFDGDGYDDATEFNPEGIERFNTFQPSQEALEEVRSLISRVLGTSETSVSEFDGGDIEAIIDSLRTEEGLSDEEISTIITNDAVATITLAYLDISQDARSSYTYYYVDPNAAQDNDRYLGYCANTQAQLDEAEEAVACNEPSLDYTRNLLRARVNTVTQGQTVASEVADAADEAYEAVYQEVDPASCSAGSSSSALQAAW